MFAGEYGSRFHSILPCLVVADNTELLVNKVLELVFAV